LQKLGVQDVYTYDKEVHLLRPLQPDKVPSLAAILDELNRQWIEVWRKAGGVKQFLGKR